MEVRDLDSTIYPAVRKVVDEMAKEKLTEYSVLPFLLKENAPNCRVIIHNGEPVGVFAYKYNKKRHLIRIYILVSNLESAVPVFTSEINKICKQYKASAFIWIKEGSPTEYWVSRIGFTYHSRDDEKEKPVNIWMFRYSGTW